MTLCSSHLFDLKRAKNIKERIVQSAPIPIHTAKGPYEKYELKRWSLQLDRST